jgi:protein-disulfide isomerase
MRMREWIGEASTLVVAVCAIAVATSVVRREFFADSSNGPTRQKPVEVKNWPRLLEAGHRLGDSSAPVTVVEFADFECPVCRGFENTLRSARARYPHDLSVIFRHWPLAYHRFAYPSARAAECAAEQGKFEPFHDLLYAKQDSLGLKSYADFARESGVPDVTAFESCANRSDSLESIRADISAARTISAMGTPAVIINGLLYYGAPASTELEGAIQGALQLVRKGRLAGR